MARRTGAKLAPLKDVVEIRELDGPKGCKQLVMKLECGHMVWKTLSRPPKQQRCVCCWWDATSA